jgi:hypothetical protein
LLRMSRRGRVEGPNEFGISASIQKTPLLNVYTLKKILYVSQQKEIS